LLNSGARQIEHTRCHQLLLAESQPTADYLMLCRQDLSVAVVVRIMDI
jgi:hypothetical protein